MEFFGIVFKVVLFIWLLLCSLQDIKKQQISLLLIALGFVFLSVISLIQGRLTFLERVIGFSLGLLLILLHKVSRGQIGLGDGLILCVTGISLGFYKNSILLINSLFLSAIFSIIYIFIKKANRKTTIPFIPFVFIASLGVVFVK